MTSHVKGALKKFNENVKLSEQNSDDGESNKFPHRINKFKCDIQVNRINQFFLNIINDFKLIFYLPTIFNVSICQYLY